MNANKKVAPILIKNPQTSYEKFENWAAKNDQKIFGTLVILSIFLSFISFNARISEAHDDALYLEGGWRYVNEFPKYFYTQNAPLYPLFLAFLIKIIGFKLIVFKLCSTLFNVFGFIFFYKALKGRVPAIVFIPVIIFQACNYLIIYYASMTFTEAFYFFLQGLFFLYAVKLLDLIKRDGVDLKPQLKTWLMFGFSMFLISTAKSSAIVVIPAVLLFFTLEKNWKALGLSLAGYLVFKIPYELIVRTVWTAQNQFAGQSKILLQKDPYDKSQGDEDLAGFIVRFFQNTNLSLSKRFYQLIGWKDEMNTDTHGILAVITVALVLFGFYKLVKSRNKVMLLFSLFTGAQLVLSFLILQTKWDQPRITLVCMPIVLILIFYAIYSLTLKPGIGQSIYIVIAALVIGSVCLSSFKRGFKNIPVIQKNLKGDKYFGYTADWQNFLKCSEWCADSLNSSALVASRKAPMSFVYGKGKKFFPIYSVIYRDTATRMSNPDSALAFFKKNKVTHVMLGSLRANPNEPGMGIINTVHHIIVPIMEAYPDKLRLVHTEGAYEQTELYEFLY
ncbi:hypothetical protein CNR22_20600 [Sphingobacteriaceae bacterium]|nr:hypothetical protein CNR22_20600 [Sphingobacteriaceae bacterium]